LAQFRDSLPDTDLVMVLDKAGVVKARAESAQAGDTVSIGGLVSQVLKATNPGASIERIPVAELPPEVLAQVRMPILATERSSDPRIGQTLEEALGLVGGAPVRDSAGQVIGAVLVADILNNDMKIVDEVTSRSPQGLPIHATIALDGIRVTTTAPAPGGGRRAVGMLYSDEVMDKLRAGQEYRGRALVGGWQWERTIYLPLRDHAGQVVAGSFVGVPEENFTALTDWTTSSTWIAVAVAVLSLAGAGLLSFLLVREGVVRPLQRAAAGVLEAADALAGEAKQTAADAEGAMQIAARMLTAVEGAGENALQTMGKVREVEVALARIGGGTEEQARAIRHAGAAISQVEGAVTDSRQMLTEVLDATREATAAMQQGRHSALRAAAALELVRLKSGEPLTELEAAVTEVDRALKQIGQATEGARAQVWDLASVLNESGARVGAVSRQMLDMSGVVEEIAAQVSRTGESGRQMLAGVEAAAEGTGAAVALVRLARGHVTRIAESNRALSVLSDRIRRLAHDLEQVIGQLSSGGRP
jgi:methyl-accepting chemotaxis protein